MLNALYKNIENIINNKNLNFYGVLKASYIAIIPSKRRTLLLLFILFISCLYINLLSFESLKAITILMEITNILNAVIIPIFGFVITGFAIFQGFLNKTTTRVLLEVDTDDKPDKFTEFSNYFFAFTIFWLILIITNIMLLFFSKLTPENLMLPFFNTNFNSILASFFLSTYIVIVLHALIELKSFLYNLVQLFMTNVSALGIESVKDEVNKNP